MKVKIQNTISTAPGCLRKGRTYDLPDDHAQELIDKGHAQADPTATHWEDRGPDSHSPPSVNRTTSGLLPTVGRIDV